MAKLADTGLGLGALTPTKFEGIFIRPITLEQSKAWADRAAEGEVSEDESLVHIFTDIVCGEDGTAFEECDTIEGIRKHLDQMALARLMVEVSEVMNMSGKLSAATETSN